MTETPIRRCAIYTRKSSKEGLEQEYNSLHAQRDACEAFIRSQSGEGWRIIKTAYDDGGFSCGNLLAEFSGSRPFRQLPHSVFLARASLYLGYRCSPDPSIDPHGLYTEGLIVRWN